MNGVSMKKSGVPIFVLFIPMLFCLGLPASAQGARLQIAHLDHLEAKASQVINVTVDEPLLRMAWKFLSDNKPDEARVKELVAGIKGVYVKSFEFDKENEFSEADVKTITSQLSGSNWSRMVDVRSKRDGQTVEVFTALDGTSKINGLAVLIVEPKQLTVVNIVGPIDIDKLSQLSGSFSIPKIQIERTPPNTKKEQ
jgi:hypothetical protein